MDLRGYEFDSNGLPIVGAAVTVYTSTLTHPPVTTETTGVTDQNGKWSFTGLSETAKDVKVVGNNQTKWYKGKTQVGVNLVFFEDLARFFQTATPAAPGTSASFLYFKSDGRPYYRSGASGSETKLANDADVAKNILTTRGDMLIEDSTPTPVRLAVGANKSVLSSNGTDPSWSTTPTVDALNVGTGSGASSGNVNASGVFFPSGQTSAALNIPVMSVTLATLGATTLVGASKSGVLFVYHATTGKLAMYGIGNGTTEALLAGDATNFDVASAANNKINVIHSSGSHYVHNGFNSSQVVCAWYIGF